MGGLMIAGSLMKAGGTLQAGYYEADQARRNQQLSLLSAASAQQAGAQQAAGIDAKASQMIGMQRAAFGASGVDSSTGSAAELQSNTRAMSALDAETAKLNAAREAWGFKVKSYDQGEQARLSKQRAVSDSIGTFLGGVAGGIGSFGGR